MIMISFKLTTESVMDANLDMKGLRTLKRPNIAAGSVKSKLNFLNLI